MFLNLFNFFCILGMMPTLTRTKSEPSDFEHRVRGDNKHMLKHRSHGSLPHQIIRECSAVSGSRVDACSTASSASSISSSTVYSDSPIGTPNPPYPANNRASDGSNFEIFQGIHHSVISTPYRIFLKICLYALW